MQAAEIRAQAQVATAQSRDQLAAEKIKVDTDRDTIPDGAEVYRYGTDPTVADASTCSPSPAGSTADSP